MRNSEVVIISDVHLGTYGCHAKELISYLKTIKPRLLILNGDIIDGWAFSKRYFPASHMEVINEFFRLLKEGTKLSISQEIMMNFCVGIPIPRWEKYG